MCYLEQIIHGYINLFKKEHLFILTFLFKKQYLVILTVFDDLFTIFKSFLRIQETNILGFAYCKSIFNSFEMIDGINIKTTTSP